MTLEEFVIALFENKQTDSDEFKAIKKIYGREKMMEIWKKYQALKLSSLK